MSLPERQNNLTETQHFNPAIVEWALPEEGIALRLRFEHPAMETLLPADREKLTLALSRLALLCEYVVAHQETIAASGFTVMDTFSFLAENLKDMTTMFQMMAGELGPTDEEGNDFPF